MDHPVRQNTRKMLQTIPLRPPSLPLGEAVQEGNWHSYHRTLLNSSARLASAWLILIGLALGPSAAWAQDAAAPHLVSAHLTAEISDGDADIQVRVQYEVTLAETTQTIPLRGLAFFGTTPRALAAFADTVALPLHWEAPDGPLLAGEIPLPTRLRRAGAFAFTLEYALPRPPEARAFDVTIPVLFVDWLPTEAPQDFFVAEITLPATYSLVEAFPTVLNREIDDSGRSRYRISLQVLPSLVRLRGYVGQAPLLTTARAIDLGVLAVLLLVILVSWRWFRRSDPSSTHP